MKRKPKIGDIVHYYRHDDWRYGKLKAYPAIITRYEDDKEGCARLKIFDCSHAEMAQVFYSDKPTIEKWSWPEDEPRVTNTCSHNRNYIKKMHECADCGFISEETPKECEHDYSVLGYDNISEKCQKCGKIRKKTQKVNAAEELIEKIENISKDASLYERTYPTFRRLKDIQKLIEEYKAK